MPFNDGSATTSDYEKSTVGNAAAQQPLQPPPPPNGGLTAWIQVLGAHFLLFNSWGLVNSIGVFQTYYQDDLLKSSNASDISWIGTVQAFLLVALSVIVGPIFDRGYSRTLIIVGTFFTVFGTMMQSLGTTYYQIFLAQGLTRHANVDSTLSFYLLAILNASSIFGRIIPGLIADKYGSLETAIACTLVAGTLGYVAIVIKNLGGLLVFAILYGFVSGAVVSLPSAIVASLTPDMKLGGTWMGQSFFLAALGILIGSPIAGTIINVPENKFSDGFIFSATLIMAAGMSYCLAKALKTKE
ncbi:hypothetical protein ACSS6W_008763 [Trichoderma asperelloides]